MRKASLICGILGMAVAVSASASIIQFDPDGPGPNPTVNAATLDFLPGDAMMVANSSFGQLFFQAKLGSVVDANGNPISVPGLNGPATDPNSFEITAVFGVGLNLVATPGSPIGSIAFTISPNGGGQYSLYFDHASDANNLAGTGFRNGTKIYGASIDNALGSVAADISKMVPLDQVNPSNYASITTPTTAGGGTVSGPTSTVDSNFFPDAKDLAGMVTTGTLATPFTHVDPSMMFTVGPDGLTSPAPFLVTSTNGDSGEIAFESDAATSFNTAVPEPGAIACLLPIAALALRRRRKTV